MRYPDRLLSEDEEILLLFRPHWKVLLPALGAAMLLAAAGGAAVAALESPWRWVALGSAIAIWMLASGPSVLRWWFTNYVLTTERIVVRRGMIARTGVEIPLEQVTNVLFSQSVLERLLGYGDVVLEAAGSQGRSELHDIPDPEGFQHDVYRARGARMDRQRSGGGGGDHAVTALERLADLRERGHLTDEEFAAEKRRLLGR